MFCDKLISRFSIQKQIMIGFLPVLCVLIFLGLSSQINMKNYKENFDFLKSATEEGGHFDEIQKDMLALQRHVLVYSYTGYRGILKKIEYLQSDIEAEFEIILPMAQTDDDIYDRTKRIYNHYMDHKKGFSEAVQRRTNLNKLKKDRLGPLYDEAEGILDGISGEYRDRGDFKRAYFTEETEEKLLNIRLNTLKYELSNDRGYINSINAEMEAIREQVRAITTEYEPRVPQPDQFDEFLKVADEFETVLNDVIHVNSIYIQLVNVVLPGKVAEIDKLIDELEILHDERYYGITQNLSSRIFNAQHNFTWLTIIAGLLGVLGSFFIARGIAIAVRDMSQTLSILASGVWDTDIPGRERRDEVGSMARAAQEFSNMVEKIERQSREIEDNRIMLSNTLENIVDGLITIDQAGNILTYNKACFNIFGYTAEEVIGQNVKILMPDPYRAEHDGYLTAYHDTGVGQVIGIGREVQGLRKNGEIFPLELSVSRVELDKGLIFCGIVRDITEMKKAQDELVNANSELEEFAYRTSHDLRSPLVSSLGLLSLGRDAIQSDNKEEALLSIDHVERSLEKLEVLVRDILSLTQIRNAEEDEVLVDVAQAIDNARSALSHMDNADRLGFILDLQYEEPLRVKESRFVLLLENLISNAIKYQNKDEEKPYVSIKTLREDSRFILIISDNGMGIPKKFQEDLFSMFKRFHPKVSFGSGLGMYMMKKSVGIMGGEIEYIDLGEGSGAMFKVTLPIK